MQKVILIVLGIFGLASAFSIGDTLFYDTLSKKYAPMNVSDALSEGWVQFTDCDPQMGIGYAHSSKLNIIKITF